MRKWLIVGILAGCGVFYATQVGGCEMIQEQLKDMLPPQQHGEEDF